MKKIKPIVVIFLVLTLATLLWLNVSRIKMAIAEATQESIALTQTVEKQNAEEALSRQLATQAQALTGQADQTLRWLLAAESLRLSPISEARMILQNETQPGPTPRMVVGSMSMSADHQYMVAANYDFNARASEIATGQTLGTMPHEGWVNSMEFSPDDKWIISGSEDKTARVWDTVTGKEISRLVHTAPVKAVAFDQLDGKYVASGGDDSLVILWQAATGKEVFRMKHNATVMALGFSPNGQYLASASADKTVRLWDVATGKEIFRMTHDAAVTSLAFSADGTLLASGSADKTARVWDMLTGHELARMEHDESVVSVAFSADGNTVISGGVAKLRTWLWRANDLLVSACSHITRNLTRAEWIQYLGAVLPYQAVCPNLPLAP